MVHLWQLWWNGKRKEKQVCSAVVILRMPPTAVLACMTLVYIGTTPIIYYNPLIKYFRLIDSLATHSHTSTVHPHTLFPLSTQKRMRVKNEKRKKIKRPQTKETKETSARNLPATPTTPEPGAAAGSPARSHSSAPSYMPPAVRHLCNPPGYCWLDCCVPDHRCHCPDFSWTVLC